LQLPGGGCLEVAATDALERVVAVVDDDELALGVGRARDLVDSAPLLGAPAILAVLGAPP
jgi:hypothetical protein